MGSTGEVAVEKSLGLNTQDEAMEFAATTQAVDQPNIPPPEDVYVPPETVQAEATEGAQEQEEEEKQEAALSVSKHSRKADSQR